MAIVQKLLQFVTVNELLGPDAPPLRIPDFQRPYSWTPRHAAQLLADLKDSLRERPEHRYTMGTVILLKRSGDLKCEVVDGQQRLLTLHLLRALLEGHTVPHLESGSSPIHLVYTELTGFVHELKRDPTHLRSFQDFLNTKAQVLQVVTNDEDEAFQFFDSQNFRGKALRPHDLLKAFHLREMANATASEQRAVVEQWETADEHDLDRLFGTYLARIHWWSRNLPAHTFTTEDLHLFKGVSRAARRLPGAEYHRAAQTVLPGMQEWAKPTAGEAELCDLKRAQHQLDAPIAAGKSFFDFASFMLAETQFLDRYLYGQDAVLDSSELDLVIFRDGARFRYCHELYVTAALYYSNKYSAGELSRVRRRLFRWAYAPRLAYERLGWRSTDNYARGLTNPRGLTTMNLFSTIRDSLDPRDVALENVHVPTDAKLQNPDDQRLQTLMKEAT